MTDTYEIEKIVIGSIMLEQDALNEALPILKFEHIENEKLRIIYKAILKLHNDKKGIDLITISNELKSLGTLESVGGYNGLIDLTSGVGYTKNIEHHCRIIIQEFLKRKLFELSKRLEFKVNEFGSDCFELIEWTQKETQNLINGIQSGSIDSVETIKNAVLSDIRGVVDRGQPSGLKTSINALNNQTNGWQKSDLIILAGRPAMGKTSVALDFALYPALNGQATAFFSLEMSKNQLVSRVLSLISQMPVQKIVTKQMNSYDIELLENDGKALNGVPFYIDDTPAIKIFDLQNKARRLKRQYDIQLLVIDYLQLMRGNGQNREGEISDISRGLKALAKELNIPIIALSQLSRAVESRSDKKPQLSDLRESGAIEQDADMVIFPFRPEYYDMPSYNIGGVDYSSAGLMSLIIAKFRNGQTGEVKCKWTADLTKIENF